MQQRLQKIIAAAGYCSRRRAEELIAAGRVRVDGQIVKLGDQADAETSVILVRDLPVRLFPVGRLDINTSGLLLMTNDGALANCLAHPSHQVDKTYLAKVRGQLSEQSKRALEEGVPLEDGLTAPAALANLRYRGGHTWFELTIHEGRNRQVRRMCEALGHQVSRLVRIGYAFLTLEGLAPGQKRMLTGKEVARLKSLGDNP
jgi:23S rRNA pseudouridine2605 synthase